MLLPVISKKEIILSNAPNFQSYLNIMQALIQVLTDENAEIRLFMVSQGLMNILHNPEHYSLQSLQGKPL